MTDSQVLAVLAGMTLVLLAAVAVGAAMLVLA